MEDETAVEAQGALGDGTQQEARRNLPMTIIETAAALKLLDQVVPDAYGAVKGAAKKGGLYTAIAGIGGMSRIPEVNAWLTKAGYTEVQSTDNSLRAYVFGSSQADAEKLQGLGGKFGAKEIILLVSMNQIKADPANRPCGRPVFPHARSASGPGRCRPADHRPASLLPLHGATRSGP